MMNDGRQQEALRLFQGALESMLGQGRLVSGDLNMDDIPALPAGTNVCRRGAPEGCVPTTGDTESDGVDYARMVPMSNIKHGVAEGLPVRSETPILPPQERGYDPYLYLTPFEILEHHSESTQLSSAIIVFNLGLCYHSFGNRHPKSAALYEIAAAILAEEELTDETFLIRIALLNNFGAWCYENAEGEPLRNCMEHLSELLDDDARSNSLPEGVFRNVGLNVRWFLQPPDASSPAA